VGRVREKDDSECDRFQALKRGKGDVMCCVCVMGRNGRTDNVMINQARRPETYLNLFQGEQNDPR
jgi:hypothetical protein